MLRRERPKGLEPTSLSYCTSLCINVTITWENEVTFYMICSHINLSKSSGFFTYHRVKHSKILHGARFALSVLYGSHNRQRPLLYTSLTDWFLYPWWKVFTARYGLIPYMKQIKFRL